MPRSKAPTCTRCDHVLPECTCKPERALLLCHSCDQWATATLEHRTTGAVAVPYQRWECANAHIEYIRYSRTDHNEEEDYGPDE